MPDRRVTFAALKVRSPPTAADFPTVQDGPPSVDSSFRLDDSQ